MQTNLDDSIFYISKVSTVREFFESPDVFAVELNDQIIVSDNYDNSILLNSVFKNAKKEKISISQILGYEKFHIQGYASLIGNFHAFFDFRPFADNYHKRGISMLEIPFDKLVKKLEPSFETEPIKTQEINGKYFISTNGLHRFTTLKLAYLIELYQGKSKEELDKKYTITVENNCIDEIKTFGKIILKEIDSDSRVHAETIYEPKYGLSGNSEVIFNEKKFIMTDNELIKFVLNEINLLKENNMYKNFLEKIVLDNGYISDKESYSTAYKLINKYSSKIIDDIITQYSIEGVEHNGFKIN